MKKLFVGCCIPRAKRAAKQALCGVLLVTGVVMTMGARAAELPAGYTAVDYIVAPAGSYIDTGYKPNQNTRVVMDVTVKGALEYWFGCWTNDYNRGAFALGNDGEYGIYYAIGDDGGSFKKVDGGQDGRVPDGRQTVEVTPWEFKVNAVTWTEKVESSRKDFQLDEPLYLFAQNRKGKAFVNAAQGDIICHGCTISEGGTAKREFVPCVRAADGVAGLYDTVEGKFYGNDGSEAFVASDGRLPGGKTTWGDYSASRDAESPLQVTFSATLGYMGVNESVVTFRYRQDGAAEWTEKPLGTYSRTSCPIGPFVENVVFRSTRPVSYEFVVTNGDGEMTWTDRVAGRIELDSKTQTESYWANKKLAIEPTVTQTKTITQSKTKVTRTCDYYTHGQDPAWGGTYAGTDTFILARPTDGDQAKRPLIIFLHGRGSTHETMLGNFLSEDGVYSVPDDFYCMFMDCSRGWKAVVGGSQPGEDYWWGARASFKGPEVGDVPGLRRERPAALRVLDCIEWIVREKGIDRNRIYLAGNSMGAQGALAIGLPHGEVFAAIEANVPATVWYASARMNFVGDDGFLRTAGERDGTLYNDPPPVLDWSGSNDVWSRNHEVLIEAMNRFRYAYTFLWGAYGHVSSYATAQQYNELVGRIDWKRIVKNAAYPVFANATGNNVLPWPWLSCNYAVNNYDIWTGDIQQIGTGKDNTHVTYRADAEMNGQLNGFLRYANVSDDATGVGMQLWVATAEEAGVTKPVAPASVTADVTLRRVQGFKLIPRQPCAWSFGGESGVARADREGLVTLRLAMDNERRELRLEPLPMDELVVTPTLAKCLPDAIQFAVDVIATGAAGGDSADVAVKFRPEGGAEWTSRPLGRLSGSTLQTVDGLVPGQAYEFRFTAENGDERTETDLGRIATIYEALAATAAVAGIGETDVTLAITLEAMGTLSESADVTAFLREENALEWRKVVLDELTAPGTAERLVGGLAPASRYALKVRVANGVDPDVEIDLGKILTGGAGGKRLVEVPMVRDLFWTGGTQRPAVDATDDYFVSRNDGGEDVDTYTVELTLRDPDSTRWTGSDSATFAVQYRIIARIPGLNTYPGVETYSCKGDVFMVFRAGTDVEFDLAYDAQADVLLVGGGGPGGMATTWSAGGAGAGGGAGGMVLSEKTSLRAGSYRVTVGEGGEPRTDHGRMNGRGGDSSLTGEGVSLLAFGGGGGGHASTAQNQQIAARGVKGGSSGGSLQYNNMYGGTPSIDGGVVRTWCKAGQGNPGGRVGNWKAGADAIFTSSSGGGGAGAAAAGVHDDNTFLPGGAGMDCDITGETVVYAGGGAGGAYAAAGASCAVAGSAGGGAGASASADGLVSGDGEDGLGGGGAGGSYYAGTLCAPGRGGRGVVIVRLREFTAVNCMHSDVTTVTDPVAPTCDAVGYTAEKFCNGCRRTVCRRVELPKLSHEYVHDDARDGDFCRHCGAESHFSQIDRILRCGDRRYVFLIAHRGLTNDTLRIPENSAASIAYAGDEGVDVVEIDPKSTADGVIILSHDMTMSRQVYGTAPEGKVGDSPTLYWNDLEDCILRVSDTVNEPSGHHICRFEEALDAAKDLCMLSLDFDFRTIGGGAQLEKLWTLVCEKGMQRQCLFDPSRFGDHRWRSNPPAGMRLSTDLDSNVSLNHNQQLGYSDRASLAHPERIGWQRRFDEGYQGTLSDNCLQMKPYLESIGRRNLEVETDTRRRVKPLIPGNRTFVRGSEIRYGARDTADYIVVNDSGEGGDPERGEFFFTLRLRDPRTTRWADTSDGDKKMWYFADFADPAIASALPTDYADRDGVACYRGTDAIEGLNWTGARRAYALGDETVLVFADVRSAELGFTVADGYYATGRCLLVGGGGPGGKGGTYTWKVSNVDKTKDLAGAGGGAGGMLETELARLESGAYDVTVGAGGTVGSSSSKPNNCGGNSLIVGGTLRLEAIGGGGGGHSVTAISDGKAGSAGVMGGSSGGSLLGVDTRGAGTKSIEVAVWQNLCVAGQGNPGGRIGGYCSGFVPCSTVGGGGAATNLNALTGFTDGTGAKFDFDYNPGNEKYDAPDNSFTGGGAGRVSDITGEDVAYAGGGAGGALFASCQVPVAGGIGGGGSVDFATRQVAARGVNMLGGGGAGGSIRKDYVSTPGEGGDGVVIVRVKTLLSCMVTVTIGEHPHMAAVWTSGDGAETNAINGISFEVSKGAKNVKVIFTADPAYEVVEGTLVHDIGTVNEDCAPEFGNLPQLAHRKVEYVDDNGQMQTNDTFTVVTADTAQFEDGWYLVEGTASRSGVDVASGCAANLILADGASLTVTGGTSCAGIDVRQGETLNIYGQRNGTGKLTATGGENAAGIGGGKRGAGGTVTINGGTVTATGGYYGAGIGGGYKGAGGAVTIINGRLDIKAGDGASVIGAGQAGDSQGKVEISGGIFAWKPNDDWLLDRETLSFKANPDATTAGAYPWAVLPCAHVTFGRPLEHMTAEWTSGDGTVTNAISGTTSFAVPIEATGVKVIFAPEHNYRFKDAHETGVRTLASPLKEDCKVTPPEVEGIPGTDAAPWKVGETVTAYVSDDGVLVIGGTGVMDDFARAADVPWAEYGETLEGAYLPRKVKVPASVAATLPISIEGGVPSGAISPAEFERIDIVDGNAYLGVCVYTNFEVKARGEGEGEGEGEGWGVATNDVIVVPAEGKQGFFYLMSKPAVPSDKPIVPPPLPIEQ